MKNQEERKVDFIYSVKRKNSSGKKSIPEIIETPIEITEEGGETRITTVSRILSGIGSGEIRLIKKESETSIEKIKPKKLENERK